MVDILNTCKNCLLYVLQFSWEWPKWVINHVYNWLEKKRLERTAKWIEKTPERRKQFFARLLRPEEVLLKQNFEKRIDHGLENFILPFARGDEGKMDVKTCRECYEQSAYVLSLIEHICNIVDPFDLIFDEEEQDRLYKKLVKMQDQISTAKRNIFKKSLEEDPGGNYWIFMRKHVNQCEELVDSLIKKVLMRD